MCVFMCVCVCVRACSVAQSYPTLWHQAALSMEFSRQGYWRGLPFPTRRGSSQQRNCNSLVSPTSAGRFFTSCATWKALFLSVSLYICMCVCVYIYNKICVCVTRVLFQTLVTYLLQNIEYSSLCYTIGLYWLWFYI